MKDRLQYIIDTYYDGNVKAFAVNMGFAPSSVYSRVDSPEKAGVKLFIAILQKHQEISAEWLMRGEEPIHKYEAQALTRNLSELNKKVDSLMKKR